MPVTKPLLGSGVLGAGAIGALLGIVVSAAFLRDPAPPSRPAPAIPTEQARPPTPEPPAVAPEPATPVAAPRGGAADEAPSSAPAAPASRGSAPADVPASVSAPAADGETEIALLQRAQDALGADPARSLSLSEEHLRRFPDGVLGQEREVLAVSALVRLGRTADARARAAQFIERHPGSAHRRRIEGLLPGGAAP